jgi:hypothetical protein
MFAPHGNAREMRLHRVGLMQGHHEPPTIAVSVRPRRLLSQISARSDLLPQRLEGADENLGEGRKRLNRVAKHVERHVSSNGKRRLLHPLAGLRPKCVGAGESGPVAQESQEPVGFGVLPMSTSGAVALKRSSETPTDAA